MFLTPAEAGKVFPIPVTARTVIHRMKHGVRGIRLQSHYDGSRYVTTKEWVDEFIRECSSGSTTQQTVAVVHHADTTSSFKAMKSAKRH